MPLKQASEYGIPLVSFSGGLDSTTLLMDLLCEYEKVDIVCVEMTGQSAKFKREKEARAAILAELEKIHKKDTAGFGKINTVQYEVTTGLKSGTIGLPQMLSWMASAINHVRAHTSGFYMGIVSGDDQVYQIESGRQLWVDMQSHSQVTGFKGAPIQFYTPLWYRKKESLCSPWRANVLRKVSWCECMEEGNDCGRCVPCTTIVQALAYQRLIKPHEYAKNPLRTRVERIIKKQIKANRPAKQKIVELK